MQKLSEEESQNFALFRQIAINVTEEAFDKLDVNGDGEVDRKEVQQLANSGVGIPDNADPALKEAKINEFFASFDENGDGKIQKSEWLNFFGQLFDSIMEQQIAGQ